METKEKKIEVVPKKGMSVPPTKGFNTGFLKNVNFKKGAFQNGFKGTSTRPKRSNRGV